MLCYLRAGDTLVVTKLDRSVLNPKQIADDLQARQVGLRAVSQGIDSTAPGGRLFFHMLAAIAEFEHDLIVERTHDGLAAARARGRRRCQVQDDAQQDRLLLVTAATGRKVQRDGIRFTSTRYVSPVLAAYVGETVTVRYDPRDAAELRVYHHEPYLCRAIAPELAADTVTLQQLRQARTARRRQLKQQLRDSRPGQPSSPPAARR